MPLGWTMIRPKPNRRSLRSAACSRRSGRIAERERSAEDNPIRLVDAFVEELELRGLGFDGAAPAQTERPSYHPAVLLKIYIYGSLNRIQSSRRLEREAQRNVELMWLTGRLGPGLQDHRRLPA